MQEMYQEMHPPWQTYAIIVLLADALAAHSRFLKTLVGDLNLTKKDRKEREEKLKRRLDKICEYIRDVTPYSPSQATLSDSPPLGHGHFHRHESVCA